MRIRVPGKHLPYPSEVLAEAVQKTQRGRVPIGFEVPAEEFSATLEPEVIAALFCFPKIILAITDDATAMCQ